jgi:hypothetical protein
MHVASDFPDTTRTASSGAGAGPDSGPNNANDADEPAPARGAASNQRRRLLYLLLGLGVTVALIFAPKVPKDQSVRFVLGAAAARVTELEVRYARREDANAAGGGRGQGAGPLAKSHDEIEWLREATFHYTVGDAPRIVTHDLRLPAGEYLLEIEIATVSARATVERKAMLDGTTSFDLSSAVPVDP